jgi:hypothetical protein
MVVMPTTPGESELDYVLEEKSVVQEATKSTFSSEILEYPNARLVMERLGQCDLVHFACHGASDPIHSIAAWFFKTVLTMP